MIKEISNFVEKIPEYYFTENLELADGLHIYIKLDVDGKLVEQKIYLVKTIKKQKIYYEVLEENLIITNIPSNIIEMEYYSSIISTNKALDLPAKKIHSSSPFVLWFKRESLDKIANSFNSYFLKSKKYFDEIEHKNIDKIKNFCESNLIQLLKDNVLSIIETKENKIKNIDYIKIYFETDISLVKRGYKKYLGSNLYNKEDYNINDGEFGLSDFLNGDNVKKIFTMHKTSRFNVNNHITSKEAHNLFLFKMLLQNKPIAKLPNPLPIFIDQDELNNKVVKIYNREGVVKFHQIINKLMQENKDDLNNYYLINWSKRGGLTINDLDFVSNFRYWLKDFTIQNFFELKNTFEGEINNIFHFEIEIVQKIFNKLLVQKAKEDKVNFRYFDELEYKSQYMTKTTFNNTLKYRKAFYDFIYKSKNETITKNLFYDLLISGILDDTNHDEFRENYHTKDRNIKEKLNIFFSLYKNFGGEDMASKIPGLREKLRKLLNEEDYHLTDNDEEFAFDAGQLIYYIIYQSETTNKTHAMLEPYISKSDPNLFKLTITRGIEQYKHKLKFGTKKFPKLASEILGYNCNTKIKELLPILLAGYFSNSLLLESNK